MLQYWDQFMQESPRKPGEADGAYLKRFWKWLLKTGIMSPDEAGRLRTKIEKLEAKVAVLRVELTEAKKKVPKS